MTGERRDIPVFVSDHARLRARERFPDFKGARIVDEVRDGMVALRLSAELPDWIVTTQTYRGALYVWNESGDRVYVLMVDSHHTDGTQFAVVTVLRRDWSLTPPP